MKAILTLFASLFLIAAQCQVNDEYKTSLKQMLELSGTEETFKTAIDQVLGMYKQNKPGVPENVWTEIYNEFSKTSLNDLVELLAPIYQKHLTLQDVKKITEFYQTPVGKKYASKTPYIMQESMQAGQQWGMKLAYNIAEKLKEKGYGEAEPPAEDK